MEVEDNIDQTGNNINRRAFTGVGLSAMAFAFAVQPLGAQINLTDVERASIQAARDFHTATERLTMESLTRVTSDDVVVWTPGLGPTPHVWPGSGLYCVDGRPDAAQWCRNSCRHP
jgi:hypothetical protein